MSDQVLPAERSGFRTLSKVRVVLPGLNGRQWLCGGLLIAKRLSELLAHHIDTEVVTSVDREDGVPFLDDVLRDAAPEDVFLITWGPHVTDLLGKLEGRRVVYYAQSTGWGSRLPIGVPVICLSRFIMASWMREAPYNALYLLGPVVGPECRDNGEPRDIDVLFVARKSTAYLADRLVPALQAHGVGVHTVRGFIPHPDLVALYRRARVYLYSSAPWQSGWVEGFGLQPLEAVLCGCSVFSNVHGGLSDFLDPELNAFKLEVHSLGFDLMRVRNAVQAAPPASAADLAELRARYSERTFHDRARRILASLDEFFECAAAHPPDLAHPETHAPGWGDRLARARAAVGAAMGTAIGTGRPARR